MSKHVPAMAGMAVNVDREISRAHSYLSRIR